MIATATLALFTTLTATLGTAAPDCRLETLEDVSSVVLEATLERTVDAWIHACDAPSVLGLAHRLKAGVRTTPEARLQHLETAAGYGDVAAMALLAHRAANAGDGALAAVWSIRAVAHARNEVERGRTTRMLAAYLQAAGPQQQAIACAWRTAEAGDHQAAVQSQARCLAVLDD